VAIGPAGRGGLFRCLKSPARRFSITRWPGRQSGILDRQTFTDRPARKAWRDCSLRGMADGAWDASTGGRRHRGSSRRLPVTCTEIGAFLLAGSQMDQASSLKRNGAPGLADSRAASRISMTVTLFSEPTKTARFELSAGHADQGTKWSRTCGFSGGSVRVSSDWRLERRTADYRRPVAIA